MKHIPTIHIDDPDRDLKLELAFRTGDVSNRRDRPYMGQPWTDDGERGTLLINGLTARDLRDCFVKGALLSCDHQGKQLYESVENNTWRTDDVYKIDWNDLDPIAVWQNMSCEIERMMGVFPYNPSGVTTDDIRKELFGTDAPPETEEGK